MKLTVEFSATELQKMLQAIAGSQEHENIWTTESANQFVAEVAQQLNYLDQHQKMLSKI